MIPQNRRFRRAEGLADALTFTGVEDNAGVVIKQDVIIVERAGVLGEGVEFSTEGRPGFAVDRMGVGGGDRVGASGVDLGVDGEGCGVYGAIAVEDLAAGVDQDQIRYANMTEVHAKGIDPKTMGIFRVAGGNVSGDAFIEAVAGKESKGGGEPLFAVQSFVGWAIELGRLRQVFGNQ